MGIIDDVMVQRAVYWPPHPDGPDAQGEPRVGDPVEVRCRWTDKNELVRTETGDEVTSMAMIMLPEITAGEEAQVGGYLWEGVQANAPEDPIVDRKAYEIIRFDKIPNFGATEFVRKAFV